MANAINILLILAACLIMAGCVQTVKMEAQENATSSSDNASNSENETVEAELCLDEEGQVSVYRYLEDTYRIEVGKEAFKTVTLIKGNTTYFRNSLTSSKTGCDWYYSTGGGIQEAAPEESGANATANCTYTLVPKTYFEARGRLCEISGEFGNISESPCSIIKDSARRELCESYIEKGE